MSTPNRIIAMVVDRASIAKARKLAEGLEGPTDGTGWTQGLNLFEAVGNHKYLFMFADGVARVVHAAPEVMTCEHLRNLYFAVSHAAAELEGRAMWMMLVDKKVEAKLRKILAKTTGTAPVPFVSKQQMAIVPAIKGFH